MVAIFVAISVVFIVIIAYRNMHIKVVLPIFAIMIIMLVVLSVVDSTKKHMTTMLKKHYSVYSAKHMRYVKDIMKKYGIDINNFEQLSMLYDLCKEEMHENDLFDSLKKPAKLLMTITSPVIMYAGNRTVNILEQKEMIITLIVGILVLISFVAAIYSLYPFFRWVFNNDYDKYKRLLYDIRQLMIFGDNPPSLIAN